MGYIQQTFCVGNGQYLIDVVANTADLPDQLVQIGRWGFFHFAACNGFANKCADGNTGSFSLGRKIAIFAFGEADLAAPGSLCHG